MSAAQMALLYRLQELEQGLAKLAAQRVNHPVVQDIAKLKDVLSKQGDMKKPSADKSKPKSLLVRQVEEELQRFASRNGLHPS